MNDVLCCSIFHQRCFKKQLIREQNLFVIYNAIIWYVSKYILCSHYSFLGQIGLINKERLVMESQESLAMKYQIIPHKRGNSLCWFIDGRQAWRIILPQSHGNRWEELVRFHSRDWLLAGVLRLHVQKWWGCVDTCRVLHVCVCKYNRII